MAEVIRTFRFLGNFRVSVNPDIPEGEVIAANLCEVFAVPSEDDRWRSFVRFSVLESDADRFPGTDDPGQDDVVLPDARQNVFLKDFNETAVTELSESVDPVRFWICDPKQVDPNTDGNDIRKGPRLHLFGVASLDQFADGTSENPSERFPTLDWFVADGTQYASILTFGTIEKGNRRRHDLRIQPCFVTATGSSKAEDVATFPMLFHCVTSAEKSATLIDVRAAAFGHPFGGGRLTWILDRKRIGKIAIKDGNFNEYGAEAKEWLPPLSAMLPGFGLTDGVEPGIDRSRLRFFSRHVPESDQHVYAIAISRRVTLPDETLPTDAQLGVGFHATAVDLQSVWTVPLTDRTILDRFFSNRALPKSATVSEAAPVPEAEKARLHEAVQLRGKLRQAIRLSDRTNVGAGGQLGPPQAGEARGKLHALGLHYVARAGAAARAAMATTDRQPQTILPDLFARATGSILLRFVGYIAPEPFAIPFGTPLLPTPARDRLPDLSLTLDTTMNQREGPSMEGAMAQQARTPLEQTPLEQEIEAFLAFERQSPRAIDLSLPQFSDIEARHPVVFAHDPRARNGGGSPAPVSVVIENRTDGTAKALSARLGSVQMTREGPLLAPPGPDLPHSFLQVRRRAWPEPQPGNHGRPILDIEWQLGLALDTAMPVASDVVHGDRAERPDDLLIAEPHDTTTDTAVRDQPPLRLDINARLQDDHDPHLTANLYDTSADTRGPTTFTLLTLQPWQALRFKQLPFTSAGRDTGEPVAEYDSDRRDWRLLKAADTYRYTLPAAAVGEDADKPGEVEIVDPEKREDVRPAGALRNGAVRRRAVDMRLSPPSTVWVEPSDLERNYFLAQANARDLFRQRGDFGAGVVFNAAVTELIYGIATGIKAPEATSERAKARLVSSAALSGEMIQSRQNDTASAESQRWPKLRAALTDYAERLEVVRIDTSRADPFQPVRFTDGVTTALRRTALLRPPAGLDPADIVAAEPGRPQPPRFADHGLAGGALWPIESANIARAVAQSPVGQQGEVSDLSFSPLGVSGNQSVRFLNGLVTVISETTDGRLHRQRVEVLGRIGVLYHRAKHVVIYERTTAASAQFVPEGDKRRSSRPILRKVEEFVEILQPRRFYPDDPETPVRTRGCLEEARFNSLTIHVNSAWGRDLGGFGWQVPLWNRDAAARRPQVYPFPEMAFVQTAEGDGAAPRVAQDCLDMANLFLIVDTETAAKQVGGVDTDLWPARRDVDYGPMCDSKVLGQVIDKLQPELEQRGARRPAASRLLPGMRRYTWRVAASPTRVRINASRGDKPIYAGVESVSLSRHPDESAELPTKYANAVGGLATVRQTELPAELAYPFDLEAMASGVPQVEVLQATFQNVKNAENSPTAAQLKALKKAADDVLNQTDWGDLEGALAEPLQQVKKLRSAGDAGKIIDAVIKADAEDCKDLAATASAALLQRRMLLSRQIREAVTDTLAELNNLPNPDPETLRKLLLERIDEASDEVFAGLGEGVVTVRRALADARAIVTDWRDQSRQALTRARARVAALRQAFDRTKPWSENRLNGALAQVAQAFDAAQIEADTALIEARQRFATELDAQSRAVGARIATAMQQVLGAETSALGTLATVQGNIHGTADMLRGHLARIPDQDAANAVIAKLTKAAKKIEKDLDGPAKAALHAATSAATAMQNFKASADQAIDEAEANASSKVTEFGTHITAISNAVTGGLTGAQAKVQDLETKLVALEEHVGGEKAAEFRVISGELRAEIISSVEALTERVLVTFAGEFAIVDQAIARSEAWADDQIALLDSVVLRGHSVADGWFADLAATLEAVENELPDVAKSAFQANIVDPVLRQVFDVAIWPSADDAAAFRATARRVLTAVAEEAEETMAEIEDLSLDGIAEAEALCAQLTGYKQQILENASDVASAIEAALKAEFGGLPQAVQEVIDGAGDLTAALNQSERLLDATAQVTNEIAEAADHAQAYVNRGLDILEDFDDARPAQMPGLALKFLSAATAAPEIAALKANADRIRVLMREAEDVLQTPELQGLFDQFGDALKALGIDFDFSEFGDDFKIKPPSGNFLRDLLPDFGGINLEDLLPSAKLPANLSDAVKVTHDLDVKAGRAWVQADVNLQLPGREKMFSIGPFTLYLRRSVLKAQVRAEADKNSDEVVTTDSALLTTTLEAVVSGQVMVTLEDVVIRYSSKASLDFDIDPKKIKIHKSLKFVQDTIGSIFGDDAGGLKFIKENGIPVGVEHQFAMPPLSLMYGTSGVSNIQIANRFSLRAYPDFVIANRFNLSRAELPFLFSFFIIGGTGYLQVDTDYRPFDSQLMVVVEAGAGGSAALGFAFGPVNGNVFIALSVVLRYQKRIGGPALANDGLSVSLLLVIAGSVSLFGIVTVYLGLRLSISYHESGRVDGLGSLSVEVRISRFFKLRYSAQITYKLRDGQSTTQVEENTQVSGQAVDAINKAQALAKARKSI